MNIYINKVNLKVLLGILIFFLSLLFLRLFFFEYNHNFYDFALIIGVLIILFASSMYSIKKLFYIFILILPIIIFLGKDRFIYVTLFEEAFIFFILIWLVKTLYSVKFGGKIKFNLYSGDIAIILLFAFATISAIYVLFKEGNLNLLFSLKLEKLVMTWQGEAFYPVRRAFIIFEGLLAYLFARANVGAKELKELKSYLAYSALIFAAFAFYDYFFRDLSAFYHGFNRVNSVFANPNVYGTYSAMILPFVLSWAIDKCRNKMFFVWKVSVFIICLLGLVLSYSKGAYTGLIASLILFAAFYNKEHIIRNRKNLIRIGLALLIFFILVFLFYIKLHTPIEIQRTSHGRFYIWSAGLNMIGYDLLFGIGSGLFYRDLKMYYPEGIRPWTEHEHGHNLFIQNFAELGIIGGGLLSFVLIGLFVSLFYRFKEINVENACVFCAVFSVLTHSLIDYTLLSSVLNVIFWIFVGIGYNLLESRKD